MATMKHQKRHQTDLLKIRLAISRNLSRITKLQQELANLEQTTVGYMKQEREIKNRTQV